MTTAITLHPSTPTELLTYILNYHRHPTTIIIASPKQPFLDALTHEVRIAQPDHGILQKTLLQTAVSRHIRLVFTPTPTHLRAYLATFTRSDARIPPPPVVPVTRGPPLLLVYGFLEVHRLTSEWSAQGLGNSAAALVDAAARENFRAAVADPRGGGDSFDTLDEFLGEGVPILSGTSRRDSGLWPGRTVGVGRVLARWFHVDDQ